MNIIVDLDGTLIDYRERAWKLFFRLTNGACTKKFYFHQKSIGRSNHEILHMINKKIELSEFDKLWLENIESSEYLEYDSIIVGLLEWMREAKDKEKQFYLCTARRNKENLFSQLEGFRIIDFLSGVFMSHGNEKTAQFRALMKLEGRIEWIITDSPVDIKSGKKLGLRTCSVGTGFRSNKTLAKYLPDLNISSCLEFPL